MTSINDKLARKKYISEFRILLMLVTTISMLPNMVKMYKNKNITKRTFCSFGFCVRPRGQSESHCFLVPFPWFHLFLIGADFRYEEQFTYKSN